MTFQPLSLETQRRVDRVFAPEQRHAASLMLVEECGNNLPFMEEADAVGLERIRFAAIKLSGGDLGALRQAIDLAKTDWRDLLMAAGFGEDATAHTRWRP